MDFTFSIESEINASKELVWQHVTQMKNVNAELMPYVRMTYPDERSEIAGREIPLNTVLFKSVLLLFGFIPIDLHFLRLEKLDTGNAFYENSYSLQHHYWKHTRTLKEVNGKTLVRDEVHFAPRISITGYLLLPVCKTIFRNRHKQLQKHFV
jgi:ligand-binding SRPBCC domain-containing protein